MFAGQKSGQLLRRLRTIYGGPDRVSAALAAICFDPCARRPVRFAGSCRQDRARSLPAPKLHAKSITAISPDDIKAVFAQPRYANAIWGVHVVDLDSGEVLIDMKPDCHLLSALSARSSIGTLLNQVGPAHRYNTPVYRQGEVKTGGVLDGDLIVVASGDLTMGGRTKPDGTIAVSNLDHNEADSLGNAVLTKPNPLAGYRIIAHEVAQSGITEVTGNVVIDDRLFQPFNFRDEFYVTTHLRERRPRGSVDPPDRGGTVGRCSGSANFGGVQSRQHTRNEVGRNGSGRKAAAERNTPVHRTARLFGHGDRRPANRFIPPLTGKFPLVQTFRISEPSNYARTVFIEALRAEGVRVDAAAVAQNPVHLLPGAKTYPPEDKVAKLVGFCPTL